MKKLINLVALAALLFVPWHAKAQLSLPISMDFENETAYNSWTVVNGASGWSGSGTGRTSDQVRNGSYCFMFYYSTNPPQYLISPELSPLSGPAQVEFWYKAASNYYTESFMLGWSSTTTDASAFTWGPEMAVTNTDYQKYEGLVPAGTKYVCIKYTANNQYYLYIDDIVIQDPPTCIAVSNLTMQNIDSNSITVVWTDTINSVASYSVAYWTTGSDTTWTTTSDTFFVATDLNASTPYSFRVRATCSSTDSSAAVNATFRTACGAITLPYTVDFEDAAYNGAWYPCWDSTIHAGTDPSVNDQNDPANHTPGGIYAMYLQANTSEPYNLVVSPQVPLPGNQIFVSFWARVSSSNNAWIKAGVMTNPYDTSTFIPLVECSGNNWTEYSFTTSTLDPDATYYIAWLGRANATWSTAFIGKFDDVVIREDNGCNKPNMAIVDSVAPYEAYLTWTTGGASATAYDIFYGTSSTFADAQVINGISSSDDTIHYTLSNLLPQTTYYAWVRTVCGSDSSDAKAFGSFTTDMTCAPVINAAMSNISYTAAQISWAYDTTQGFPSEGVQITLVDNTDSTAAPIVADATGTSYTFSNLAASHSYTATLRNLCQTDMQVDTASGVSVGFMTLSCSEIVSDGSTNNYIPTYTYYGNTYAQMIYTAAEMPAVDTIHGIAFNITSANSGSNAARTFDVYMTAIDTNAFNSNNYMAVDSSMRYATAFSFNTAVTGWQAITFDRDFVYDGSSNLLVTINDRTGAYGSSASYASIAATGRGLSSYRDGATDQYDPATMTTGSTRNNIPAIRFMANCEVPQCFAPMVSVDAVDSNNITVSWEAVGTESEWAIGIKPLEATAIAWEPSTTSNTTFTFSNLVANTAYDIYVGSLCNGDTLMATVSVRTMCGAMVLPYTTSFEGETDYEAPSCWTVINGYDYSNYDYITYTYVTRTYPLVDNSGHHTGSHAMSLRSNNVNTLIASSAIPASGSGITVSFWAENYISYGSSTLEAGLVTSLSADSTFIPMVTINSDNDYALYEFQATLAPDTTYYLAFRYNSSYDYNYAGVDDINIRLDDGCHRPTNVTAIGTNVDEIDVTWTSDGAVSDFAVEYRQRNASTWSAPLFTSTTSYTLTGLDTATAYEVRVGTICTADTLWNTTAVYAKTQCAPMTVPYFEGFENDMANEEPACWNISGQTYYYAYYNTTYPAVTTDGPQTGSNALEFSSLSGPTIVSSMAVPLPGDSIYVSFWAELQGNTYYGNPTLEAGVMTNPAFDTTFIPLLTITGDLDYAQYEFNTATLSSTETYYVAFRYTAPNNYLSAFVDDINIRLDEGCMYPSNVTATPTSNSAAIAWHNAGAAGSTFVVEYRTAGGTWSTPATTTDTTFSLTSLSGATTYEVRVGFVCGTDTLWTASSFTTDCTLLPVPYAENFDAYANDVMPPCWGWNSSFATHWDGGVFLRGYHGGGSEYVVVPELDGAISKLKIEFDTKVGTIAENDGILIGVADASGTLLAWLDTIQDANFSRNAHVRKTVYFTNYNMPAGAARVAFAQLRNWGEWALIDNINIEVLPDCYPVDNLVGHNLDDIENTTFSWTPQGYATEWQVYVDTVTVGIDSLATLPDSLFTTVYDTFYTLPLGAVQGGGIYNFFVRSQCSAIDHSGWVKNEFGAGTIIMNQTTDTVEGCGFVVYDNGGPIAGYLANTNTELVIRTENVGSQLQIFGAKFGFGMDAATLTVYDGEGTTGDVLYTYNTVNGRDTLLNTVLATSTTGSMTITFVVNGSMCHTGYELYIRCTDGALCPRPTELQAQMTSETTATATWTGTASNYNFYYRIAGSETWVRQNVNTNSVDLTGLVADTVYDMYVVAICSATDSSTASAVRQLRTYRSTPELEVFTVVVNSADATMGTATADHTGEVQENTVVTATATANSGYHFTNWTSNGNVVSTDNPYTFTLTADITLTANFEQDSTGHEGIDDIDANAIALYPNPATTTVTISGISGQATVSIVDMNGREVHTQTIKHSSNQTITLDLTGYAQGAYFVRIVGEQQNAIRKLIVK
ncbi:MAG: fibronectin type III domain-containing protein [Bacteroidales bacterium]|nr:fibronectin type III domain-containing protein [Bacteroidales bacterium]